MDFLNKIFPFLPFCGLFLVLLLLGIGFTTILLNRIVQNIHTCPKCEAKSAGHLYETKEHIISNNVNYQRLNPIRVKEYEVIDYYECEACSYIWERQFKRIEQKRLGKIE